MKIYDKLTWQNDAGVIVEMAPTLPITVENATGMDGLKNTIYSSKTSGQDGETQTNMSLGKRNITLLGLLQLEEDMNHELLLAAFSPKVQGVLTYTGKTRTLQIRASVEQAPTFTDGEMNPGWFVSLIAPDPYWVEPTQAMTEIAAWLPAIEFDFEIDDEVGVEFEFRAPSVVVNVKNNGNVTTGMQVIFRALGTVVRPQLLHLGTREVIQLNTTMLPGEQIVVNTVPGQKSVQRTQSGVTTNAFQLFDMDSKFFGLLPGDNQLCYSAESGRDMLNITVASMPRYLGV